MNCTALDNLLDRAVPQAEWPSDARAHLAACPRCRALEEAFSRFSSTPAPQARYAALTQQLVSDLAPVGPLPPLPVGALLLSLCAAGIGALLASATGSKGWLALDPARRAVIFSVAMLATTLQATFVALEMEPGRGFAPAVRHAPWLVSVLFAAASAGLFPWAPAPSFLQHWALCFARAAASTLVILAFVYLFLRRGYFVDPRRAGAAVGLLAGLGAFVSQELYCPILETAHVAASHVGLLLVSSLAGYLLGAAVARRRQS